MGITIRDVAAHAGVSIATVSRVLNNTCPVSDDKRRAVKAAARELGYVPNAAARSLQKRETGGLGILMPYVTGEFFSEFLSGLDLTARDLGYYLLISTSHEAVSEWRAAMRAMHQRVDGLLVYAPNMTPGQLSLNTDEPTVFVNTPTNGHRTDAVDVIGFDNEESTYVGVRYLIDLGHRRIAYVSGPEGWYDADARTSGYRRAVKDLDPAGCPVFVGDFHQDSGMRAARAVLEMRPRPTAIAAANDYCAMGVLIALAEAGLSIPEDMSVLGFDDVPSARYTSPPLTTMRVPIRRVGEEAIRLLVRRIRHIESSPPRVRNLEVELIRRGTTASPKPG